MSRLNDNQSDSVNDNILTQRIDIVFSDLPFQTSVGYLYLLAFVFLIVVVMMNLLNGLAVSDTGVIKEEAEIYAYKGQVEIISYLEAMMLGGKSGERIVKLLLNLIRKAIVYAL